VTPEENLARLGIALPAAAAPVANYVGAKAAGGLLFVSGQLPFEAGKLAVAGLVGRDVTLEQAVRAARVCAVNIVAAVRAAAGSLDRLEAVRVEGFVASAEGFTDQPKVINGCSDFLVEVFGERGRHARFAVGVPALPLGAPVEIAAVFKIV
jgi:enamine deaminase RidA (YjgF/YER057c/UK114 family)